MIKKTIQKLSNSKIAKASNRFSTVKDYSSLDEINGFHPLKSAVPKSYVPYKARKREGGKVAYFNFPLAKEMGLIPKDHPDKLNKALEKKLLDTFGLIIINEYDLINQKQIPKRTIKPNNYMATRYLQLQHPNKRGETSGDGRSIWNGEFVSDNGVWDISSCGTGATKLSPATAINNKFYESGDPSISYGCGYAELLDGLAAAVMSEIFHNRGIKTERTLCLIEFENNYSVNVRAYPNLLRPSHMFMYLKQDDVLNLKRITDFYLQRQISNGIFPAYIAKEKNRYHLMEDFFVDSFAKIAAQFESEYIFCWLDWDGDNILSDGGIIDYGSVRQFGLFHHEYRYDDDDRFSTTIKEQKLKAKLTVQIFLQMFDYIRTGKKKRLDTFAKHKKLKTFEQLFSDYKAKFLLEKVGFNPKQVKYLFNKRKSDVIKFQNIFEYFEKVKSSKGLHKVGDGINENPVYRMHDFLRIYPELIKEQLDETNSYTTVGAETLQEFIASSYANMKDLNLTQNRRKKFWELERSYLSLVRHIEKEFYQNEKRLFGTLINRSHEKNKYFHITGDSMITVANELLAKKSTLKTNEFISIINEFITLNSPEKLVTPDDLSELDPNHKNFFKIIEHFREGI